MRLKPNFLLFSLLVLLADFSFGQSKKELEDQVSGLQSQVQSLTGERDSLATQNQALAVERDSLTKTAESYQKFYFFIRDNYFPEGARDLSPAQATGLVDSLSSARDSTLEGLQRLDLTLADSIKGLRDSMTTLEIQNKAFRDVLGLALSAQVYPRQAGDLQGSWKVFLEPVDLVGTNPQAGLVSRNQMVLPDSIYKGMITRIDFLEDELADVYFAGGKRIKCFFKVTDFDLQKTYFIDLSHGKELDIQLYITHVPKGIQVSYQMPAQDGASGFYFGYMTR